MPVTISSNMVHTATVHMSKYIIWTSPTQGEYVIANEVEDDGETVTFLIDGRVVRKEKLKDIEGYSQVET